MQRPYSHTVSRKPVLVRDRTVRFVTLNFKAVPVLDARMSDNADTEPCDWCGEAVANPLSRTVRVTVDRSQIDSQRLCPECFANWIDRFDTEMKPEQTEPDPTPDPTPADDETDIIVD